MSVPCDTPLAKNCTLAMAPVLAVAVAVRVVAALTETFDAAVGAVMLTVGAVPAVTLTLIAAEVVWLPRLSRATARNA